MEQACKCTSSRLLPVQVWLTWGGGHTWAAGMPVQGYGTVMLAAWAPVPNCGDEGICPGCQPAGEAGPKTSGLWAVVRPPLVWNICRRRSLHSIVRQPDGTLPCGKGLQSTATLPCVSQPHSIGQRSPIQPESDLDTPVTIHGIQGPCPHAQDLETAGSQHMSVTTSKAAHADLS